ETPEACVECRIFRTDRQRAFSWGHPAASYYRSAIESNARPSALQASPIPRPRTPIDEVVQHPFRQARERRDSRPGRQVEATILDPPATIACARAAATNRKSC